MASTKPRFFQGGPSCSRFLENQIGAFHRPDTPGRNPGQSIMGHLEIVQAPVDEADHCFIGERQRKIGGYDGADIPTGAYSTNSVIRLSSRGSPWSKRETSSR